MSTKSRLDKLYRNCKRIRLPEDAKILFIADLHMGDGGPEDDYSKNEDTFLSIIKSYYETGYFLVILGDFVDLWEAKSKDAILNAHYHTDRLVAEFIMDNKLIQIKGNHDNDLEHCGEAIVLQIGDMEIFCCHGHQGDIFNDRLYWIGKYAVRYFWVPFQWLGLYDLTRAKKRRHEKQEERLMIWAGRHKGPSIFGHTHFLKCGRLYRNAGCWVEQGGEAIEYSNGKFEERRF